MDMVELLLPCGFDTLEYSGVKATIVICTLTDYSVAKECQHCTQSCYGVAAPRWPWSDRASTFGQWTWRFLVGPSNSASCPSLTLWCHESLPLSGHTCWQ
jgi:hypothetical protein